MLSTIPGDDAFRNTDVDDEIARFAGRAEVRIRMKVANTVGED